MALPTCTVCGHQVTLTRDLDGHFSCWCWCANASRYDSDYRKPGRGGTEAEAVASWQKSAR